MTLADKPFDLPTVFDGRQGDVVLGNRRNLMRGTAEMHIPLSSTRNDETERNTPGPHTKHSVRPVVSSCSACKPGRQWRSLSTTRQRQNRIAASITAAATNKSDGMHT